MDPVRRALFLLFFASVVLTEPTQARALAPERGGMTPVATAQWIQRIAISLRRTVEPAALPPAWHRYRPSTPAPTPLDPQVAAAHPVREADAFRLPPPTC
jgi:hypothetical protein